MLRLDFTNLFITAEMADIDVTLHCFRNAMRQVTDFGSD